MTVAQTKRALATARNPQVRGQFAAMLRRIAVQNPKKLERVANKLLDEAEKGNMVAIKELIDRLDGRAVQATEISGPDGSPIEASLDFARVLAGELLSSKQEK